jgi:putative phosphoribosyl transferase
MDPGSETAQRAQEREIFVSAGEARLGATLHVPQQSRGIVLFAHGSGSSSRSPRNRLVARVLQSRSIATLLFDLLTRGEELVDEGSELLRFNIGLLASRLRAVTESLRQHPEIERLPVGYFGASTGAAAALVAAAETPDAVAALVSRGGRPDLAVQALRRVHAPTLLIVGGKDKQVIQWNRKALAQLRSTEKDLIIVPGASHLFEEPGAHEEVARLAAAWFERFLPSASARRPAAGAESSQAERAS